jgi:hypothetical protein
MKKIQFLLVTFLIILTIPAFSQDDLYDSLGEKDEFIYLYSGKLLRRGEFEIKDKFLSKRKFYYKNGEEIKTEEINFYGDGEYFYGKNKPVSDKEVNYTFFLKREKHGAIDLYYYYTYVTKTKGRYSRERVYTYVRKFGEIKSINYENLKEDLVLSDDIKYKEQNKLITHSLEKGNKNRKAGPKVMAAGFAVFIVGAAVYSGADENENNNNKITGFAISLPGFVTTVVGLGMWSSARLFFKAIDLYNEAYK